MNVIGGAARRWLLLAAVPMAVLLAAPSAGAQTIPSSTVSIGAFSSEGTCSLIRRSAGSSALVVTSDVIAAAARWETWFERDCVDNFATLRRSIEAALAASGKVSVAPGSGYVVSGRVSDIGTFGGPGGAPPAEGYLVASGGLFANLDIVVRDRAGRTVFGTLITKRIETASTVAVSDKTSQFSTRGGRSGQALYTELQHALALAAARQIAFQVAPLKVVAGGGDKIQLNYGAPLLAFGTIIQATSPDGFNSARYTVVSARPSTAVAEVDGGGNTSQIGVGSSAVVLEPEDPASNGRRFDRVDLP